MEQNLLEYTLTLLSVYGRYVVMFLLFAVVALQGIYSFFIKETDVANAWIWRISCAVYLLMFAWIIAINPALWLMGFPSCDTLWLTEYTMITIIGLLCAYAAGLFFAMCWAAFSKALVGGFLLIGCLFCNTFRTPPGRALNAALEYLERD